MTTVTETRPDNKDEIYGHTKVVFKTIQDLLPKFISQQWYNNSYTPQKVDDDTPYCPQISVGNCEEQEIIFQNTNILFSNFNLSVREIWGDGNCGFYGMLLGLAALGKVLKQIFKSAFSLAAAMFTLHYQAAQALQTISAEFWSQSKSYNKDGDEYHLLPTAEEGF